MVDRRPRTTVVVTGSELVRGDRRDLNGPFLASELLRLGLEPDRVVIVGDRPEELEAAIREGVESDVCVLSGGLGPTHDDRTVELLARALGRELHVDAGLEREIGAVSRGYAERLGRPFSDFVHGVRKQASLPAGAVNLGLAGTAPGVLVEHGGRVAIALPGPPGELQRLWPAAAEHPALRAVLARLTPRAHRTLRFFGPSESAVATVIDAAGGEAPGLDVTVCARDFEIHVDLFVEQGAEALGDAMELALREGFGAQLFSRDERPVEELVVELCRARSLTLATAESCTGGMVGARLTDVPGASDVYLGGVVAYANDVKEGVLRVPGAVLGAHGAVSSETAAAMAAGVRAVLGADVGAAVTGVAGPGGGSPDKPVGLVHIHVETPNASESMRFELPGDRSRIRGRATAFVLHQLRTVLSGPGAARA